MIARRARGRWAAAAWLVGEAIVLWSVRGELFALYAGIFTRLNDLVQR